MRTSVRFLGLKPDRFLKLSCNLLCNLLFIFIAQCVIASPLLFQTVTIVENIRVHSRNDGSVMAPSTNIQAGPSVGDILNRHLFPGLEDFRRGNYNYSLVQMNYFLERPQYTSQNPRQSEFMSTAHYTRGIIYLDHADGRGRLRLALKDFQAALKWNPENHPALLGMARTHLVMDHREESVETLKLLLSKNPPPLILEEAKAMLKKLESTAK